VTGDPNGTVRRVRDAAGTKDRIVTEGRRQFAAGGYHGTTVKAVADAAGVSPNLITRYFGGKEGLFLAVTQVGLHLDRVLPGPRESLGSRLAQSMVSRWNDVQAADPLLVLQRSASDHPSAAAALVAFLDRESRGPLVLQLRAYGLSVDEANQRAAAVEALVMGVVTRRRVLSADSCNHADLEAWLAQSIQRLLDAP